MDTFWDTGAFLALIYDEPHSAVAEMAARQTAVSHAWWWMEVETRTGMLRRGTSPGHEKICRETLAAFAWIDLPRTQKNELIEFNRVHRLRSADAAHLFCFRELSRAVEGLTLVTFDEEMVKAAKQENLTVFSP